MDEVEKNRFRIEKRYGKSTRNENNGHETVLNVKDTNEQQYFWSGPVGGPPGQLEVFS